VLLPRPIERGGTAGLALGGPASQKSASTELMPRQTNGRAFSRERLRPGCDCAPEQNPKRDEADRGASSCRAAVDLWEGRRLSKTKKGMAHTPAPHCQRHLARCSKQINGESTQNREKELPWFQIVSFALLRPTQRLIFTALMAVEVA